MITIHRNLNVEQALKKTHLLQGSYSGGCLWVITPCSGSGSPSGRVEAYTQYACLLGARAKVGKTPSRVQQGRRAVFARIYGDNGGDPSPSLQTMHIIQSGAREVTFNPFSDNPSFTWKDTGESCNSWAQCWFTPSGMFAI